MHTLLEILHPLTASIRLLERTIYHVGPGALARHTMVCAWLVSLLCLCGGGYDLARGRRFDALLWVGMAGILFTAFWLESTLSGGRSVYFAMAAVAIAVWLLGRALFLQFTAPAVPARRLER
jgi:hypothetical protein